VVLLHYNLRRFPKKKTISKLIYRYHVDSEQKYADHRPGVISEELRNALGLRPNQLPLHIYHMRVFGYPPGYLTEMIETRSGITLFDDSQGIYTPKYLELFMLNLSPYRKCRRR